jgi:hypothetical protein
VADSNRIVVAQLARVYLAPITYDVSGVPTYQTAPVNASSALGAGWTEVGFFTPDSLKWATEPTFETVNSHQSRFPTRRFQTQDDATIEVDLQEWSGDNFRYVYGGGTVTSLGGGVFKFTPPAVGSRLEVSVVIEIIDGVKKYRRVIPRAQQVEGVEQSYGNVSESILPLRLAILGQDGVDPFYDLIEGDPAFTSTITVPGTPTAPTNAAGVGQATVTFTAPTAGGGTIAQHEVAASTGQSTLGASSPLVITGLTAAVAVRTRVRSRNEAGWGPWSAWSTNVTPT